jgi:TonB family protein
VEVLIVSNEAQRWLRRLACVCLICFSAVPGIVAETGRGVKTKTVPVYPELARKMNISGTVKLQLIVEPGGEVKTVKPLGGHPLLIDSAVNAVKEWKYVPAGDETVELVSIVFNAN